MLMNALFEEHSNPISFWKEFTHKIQHCIRKVGKHAAHLNRGIIQEDRHVLASSRIKASKTTLSD